MQTTLNNEVLTFDCTTRENMSHSVQATSSADSGLHTSAAPFAVVSPQKSSGVLARRADHQWQQITQVCFLVCVVGTMQ